MAVYEEENRKNGKRDYPTAGAYQQILFAEQDFYQYLRECFFTVPGSFYAVWEEKKRYVSALRMEPFQDGLLLAGLETMPECRRRGYGALLVTQTLEQLRGMRVYAHVEKGNLASLRLHEKCGFRKIMDHAVYIDGSVRPDSVTFCIER